MGNAGAAFQLATGVLTRVSNTWSIPPSTRNEPTRQTIAVTRKAGGADKCTTDTLSDPLVILERAWSGVLDLSKGQLL
jgi:hypothetical protein